MVSHLRRHCSGYTYYIQLGNKRNHNWKEIFSMYQIVTYTESAFLLCTVFMKLVTFYIEKLKYLLL